MERINIIIADSDTDYLDLFVNYIRTSDYANKFAVKSFSRRESLEQYINSPGDSGIYLVTPELMPEDPISLSGSAVIVLKNESGKSSVIYPEVYKYQALNLLLDEVLKYYLQEDEEGYRKLSGNRATRIISIYSANGGVGKSTLAINLAAQLARQNQKVFYLNLEFLSSAQIWLQSSDNNDFSKVLYYLKTNPNQVEAKFETLKKHDQLLNIDFFESPNIALEMLDLNREEVKTLIDIVANKGVYDVIISDLESSIGERIIGSLESSDVILWLVTDDIQSLHKTRNLMQEFTRIMNDEYAGIFKKVKFVLNKRLNMLATNPADFGINLTGFLPYIPEWKAINRKEQLLTSSFYNQEVIKLYSSLTD
jgi:cellulose biosynthesis protein BcsQ